MPLKQTLSPKDLAEAVGVSESSLKRWADDGLLEVSRTAGGHRRIAIAEAIRYIRQAGLPVVNPSALGLADLETLEPKDLARPNLSDQPLVDAIMKTHAQRARGLILGMYVSGRSVGEICDGPITRAMHAVGDLWKHSPEGILIEHRATDICAQALHQLRGLLPPPSEGAPVATGGTPAGDPYMLTSLMAATVLAAEGWAEENLGPDVPIELMVEAANRHRAALVWLSVSSEKPVEELTAQIQDLGKKLQPLSATLVVGGRALPPRSTLLAENVNPLGNMSELTAFVRGLRSGTTKRPESTGSAADDVSQAAE